jgi:hypothetical protein
MCSTGQRQQALAAIIAKYAKDFSPGELRAAIRLGAPEALEGSCPLCDAPLKLYCPACSVAKAK